MQAGRSCIHQLWSSPLGPYLLICISSNAREMQQRRECNQPAAADPGLTPCVCHTLLLSDTRRKKCSLSHCSHDLEFKYDTLKMEMKNAGVCSSLAHLRQFLQNPKWFQAALRFWQPRAAKSPLWGEGKRVQAASSPLTLSREQSPRGRH